MDPWRGSHLMDRWRVLQNIKCWINGGHVSWGHHNQWIKLIYIHHGGHEGYYARSI